MSNLIELPNGELVNLDQIIRCYYDDEHDKARLQVVTAHMAGSFAITDAESIRILSLIWRAQMHAKSVEVLKVAKGERGQRRAKLDPDQCPTDYDPTYWREVCARENAPTPVVAPPASDPTEDTAILDYIEAKARAHEKDMLGFTGHKGYAWSATYCGCPAFSVRDDEAFYFRTLRDSVRTAMAAEVTHAAAEVTHVGCAPGVALVTRDDCPHVKREEVPSNG